MKENKNIDKKSVFIVPLYCKCLGKNWKEANEIMYKFPPPPPSTVSESCWIKLLHTLVKSVCGFHFCLSDFGRWQTLRHTAQHIWETLKTWKAHHHKNQHKTPMRYSWWFVSTVNSALWNVFVPHLVATVLKWHNFL